jgi:hypothetical protein
MKMEEQMIRRLTSIFIVMLMISVFVASPVNAAKSYYAEYFNVQIDLQEGGSAIVTETVKFHFAGDPFTFAFREVSAAETDGVTFLEASMDGAPMPQGTEAGQVEVEAGDPLKVRWHFAPTSEAAHVFVVRYRVEGIIRKEDGDTLVWRAIPEEHEYTIDRSTITLTYPSSAARLGEPGLDWDFDSAWEENRVILTANGISADEDLIVTAHFAENSLTRVAPRWQVQEQRADAAISRALPFALITGALTLLFGALGLFTFIRAHRRDLIISPVVSTANPPSDISPAIIGKMTGQQHTFMGAIFDLAQRGILEVREERGFLGSGKHVLIRTGQPASLKPFEQGLMDALFKSGEIQTSEAALRIDMSEVATRLAMGKKLFDEPLEQELVQRGWLDRERKQRRSMLIVGGLITLIGSMGVFILTIVLGGASLSQNSDFLQLIAIVAGASASMFVLSIALLVYGAAYSVLTPMGEEQSTRWKGFAEYLKQVSKGREPAIRPDYFEKYLAYAAVFGLGAGWAKYFEKLGGVPLPVWFHTLAGSDRDFGAMVAVMSASDTTGASAGADGGGGASGGGSSGAG